MNVNRQIDFWNMSQIEGGNFVFYDIFLELCQEKHTTPAKVRADLGISQSTVASWKSRGLTPNAKTLQKISDYFDASIDYLLGLDDSPHSNLTLTLHTRDGDLAVGDRELGRILEELTADELEDVQRFAEFVLSKRYQAQQAPQSPPALTEGKDTTPPPDAPETPPEGE